MRHVQGHAQHGWDTDSTRQCYLFATSLPPHRVTEQVSLKKCPPPCPCVRVEIRHWRDQQTEEAKQRELPWKWPHTAHNTRESPRYIFTIFTIILFFWCCLIVFSFFFFFSFFKLFKIFKSSISPLIFIFITYYYFSKKNRHYF